MKKKKKTEPSLQYGGLVKAELFVHMLFVASKRVWPIRVGCLDPKAQIPKLSMMAMQSLCSDDGYFITLELSSQGFRRRTPRVSFFILFFTYLLMVLWFDL